MNQNKMVLGYIAGGSLVLVIMPGLIYLLTSLLDSVISLEIIRNPTIRWISAVVLLITGFGFGFSSIVFQNTRGEGGPLEIGNIEISPKTKNLVVSGPYKYTRNPMLFGTFLIYLAYSLILNSIFAIALVVALFTFMLTVVVKLEEKRLAQDFGAEYKEYRKKVSRFIPWFHRKPRSKEV
jgi:protein-S-isoprenylcysteine O-methyltransferase Ste14